MAGAVQRTCVWVGCPTSHGGTVLPVENPIRKPTQNTKSGYLSYAKDGDLVSCPIHGNNRLIAVPIAVVMDGKYAITEGCLSECGSVVTTPHDFVYPVTVKDDSEETDLKLMYPNQNHVFKISSDADWHSINFNTNKHGPHQWHWHIHWKSSNPHGTHPLFEKSGVANTSDGRWDAVSVIKNLGGTLDLTVKWKNKLLKIQIKIQGTNPTQDQIHDYLKDKENGEWLYQIINQESKYHHFDSKHDYEPLTSFDNGYGLCQLTNHPIPSYEQIWNWKSHLDAGIAHLKNTKNEAKNYLSAGNYTEDQLKRETYCRYNGGFYYKWDEEKNCWKRRDDIHCITGSTTGWKVSDPNQKHKEFGVCYADKILGYN